MAAAPTPAPAAPLPPITDFDSFWAAYHDTLLGWTLNVGAAALILVLGLWVAGALRKFLRRRIETGTRIDRTLAAFLASLVYYVLIAFVLIAVLSRFGVQTTSLVAMLGAATLAIGLALQGTLSNVAAGVMVILLRPYSLGDTVEIGPHAGTVVDISLFTTELATADNIEIILPNSLCWGQPIRNVNKRANRRIDLTVSVAYDTDAAQATKIIEDVVASEPRVQTSPDKPWVGVVGLGPIAMDLQLRAWVKTVDYGDTRVVALRKIKDAFDAAGIRPPGAPMPAPPPLQPKT